MFNKIKLMKMINYHQIRFFLFEGMSAYYILFYISDSRVTVTYQTCIQMNKHRVDSFSIKVN